MAQSCFVHWAVSCKPGRVKFMCQEVHLMGNFAAEGL